MPPSVRTKSFRSRRTGRPREKREGKGNARLIQKRENEKTKSYWGLVSSTEAVNTPA